MAAFLAPLPVLHVCAIEDPHVGSIEFRGVEVGHHHDCGHHHSEDEAPRPSAEQLDADEVQFWLTHGPELPKTKFTQQSGFTLPPEVVSQALPGVDSSDIRGPPRSRLQLYCTLRI